MRALASFGAILALCAALALAPAPAGAQFVDGGAPAAPGEQLLLEADELIYDTETGRATAVGNVFIAYRGYQLFAREVIYDEAAGTLSARGGARLEEPEGNIIVARDIQLSDDLAEGFATALRADTIYRTRFAANSAERAGGSTVIFNDGVYTACYSCKRRPDEPPTWAIKARRIVYKQDEKTIRFEKPTFDLFGATVAALPSFEVPDPSVRRRSGFLVPTAVYSNLIGFGVRVPYFQTLGPSRDITVAATPLTRQGVLGDVEYRERTAFGGYSIRGTGIYQLDPDAFDDDAEGRDLRGAIRTQGEFLLNPDWRVGWLSTVTSDREFLSDYKQGSGDNFSLPSTVYLTGLGRRNVFDARLWGFRITQDDYVSEEVLDPPAPFSGVGDRLQGKQPIVHPAIDYEGVLSSSVLGGEFSYALNHISLTRTETDAFGAVREGVLEARFRGVEGSFSRTSAEAAWRKRFVGPLGQVLTPRVSLRSDIIALDPRDPAVDALTEDDVVGRLTPAASVSYRWPWLVAAPWGTQVIEPIAEVHARPSETAIGELPNDDAQSVVFDETNLFGPTRFSGYDRVEGGVRANVGVRYTLQTWSGANLSFTGGQSFHLAGRNSYRVPDILDSTGASGLSADRSDLVGGVTLDTADGLNLSARARVDDENFDLQRAEFAAGARTGPLSSRLVYAFLAAQPDLGIIDDREEIHGAATLRVTDRVRVFGQLRYDITDEEVVSDGVGVAYDDDALSVSLAYSEDRTSDVDDETDRTVFLRLGLRTLGDAAIGAGLDN